MRFVVSIFNQRGLARRMLSRDANLDNLNKLPTVLNVRFVLSFVFNYFNVMLWFLLYSTANMVSLDKNIDMVSLKKVIFCSMYLIRFSCVLDFLILIYVLWIVISSVLLYAIKFCQAAPYIACTYVEWRFIFPANKLCKGKWYLIYVRIV